MACNFKYLNRLKYLYTYRGVRFDFKSTLAPTSERRHYIPKSENVIEFSELEKLFKMMKSPTGPEIKNIEKSLIGKEYYNGLSNRWLEVQTSSVSFFILQCCDRFNAIDLGIKYFKYLVDSGEKIGLNDKKAFFNLVQKDKKICNENEEFLYQQYCQLNSSLEVMDYATLRPCVSLLCSLDNHWKEAIDLIKIRNEFIDNKLDEIYGLVAAAAFKKNEPEFGWEILELCKNEFVIPSLISYIEYLENLIVNNNFSVEKLHELFDYMQRKQLYLHKNDTDFFYKLKDLVNLLNNHHEKDYTWKISQSVADRETGHCPSCDKHLSKIIINSKSFNELRSAFFNDVLIGKDINIKSSHAEAKRFHKFLSSSPHFDVVLDGLNIAYRGSGFNSVERVSYLQHYINRFQCKNMQVLLLGRYHMTRWPKFKDIQRLCSVFLFDNATDDDAYLIYAAMFKGIDTCIGTGDFLRGKTIFFEDQKLTETFELWQKTHQYGIVAHGLQRHIFPPIKHDVFTHKIDPAEKAVDSGEINWHVACTPNEFNITGYNFEATIHWICLQRLSRQNAKYASLKSERNLKKTGEPFFVENIDEACDEHGKPREKHGMNNIPSDLLHEHKMKFFAINNRKDLAGVQKSSDSESPFTELDFNKNSNELEKLSSISTKSDTGNLDFWRSASDDLNNSWLLNPGKSNGKSTGPEKLAGIPAECDNGSSIFWKSASKSGRSNFKFSDDNRKESNKPKKLSGVLTETDIRNSDSFWKSPSNNDINNLLFPNANPDKDIPKKNPPKILTDERYSSHSDESRHFQQEVNNKKLSGNILRKTSDQKRYGELLQLSQQNAIRKADAVRNDFLSDSGIKIKKKLLNNLRKEQNTVKLHSDSVFELVSNSERNSVKRNTREGKITNSNRNFLFNRQDHLEIQQKSETSKEKVNGLKLAAENPTYSSEIETKMLNKEEVYEIAKEATPGKTLQKENNFETPKNIEMLNSGPKTFISSFRKSYKVESVEKKHSFADEEKKGASKNVSDGNNQNQQVIMESSKPFPEPNSNKMKEVQHEKVSIKSAMENLTSDSKNSLKPKPFVSSFQKYKHVSSSNMEDQLKNQGKNETAEEKGNSFKLAVENSPYYLDMEMQILNKKDVYDNSHEATSETGKMLLKENDSEASRNTDDLNPETKTFHSSFKKFYEIENIKKEDADSSRGGSKNGTVGESPRDTLKNFNTQTIRHFSSFKKSYIVNNVRFNKENPPMGSIEVPTSTTILFWTPDAWTSDAELNPNPSSTSENTMTEGQSEDLEKEAENEMGNYTTEDDYISKNLERIIVQAEEREKRIHATLENPDPDLISKSSFWDLPYLNSGESRLYQTVDEILSKTSEKITGENLNQESLVTSGNSDKNADKNLDEKDAINLLNEALEGNLNEIKIEDKADGGSELDPFESGNLEQDKLYAMANELLLKSSEREKKTVTRKSDVADTEKGVVTESSSNDKKTDDEETALHEILQNAVFKSSAKILKPSEKNYKDEVKTDAELKLETSKGKFYNAKKEENYLLYDRLLPDILEKYSEKKRLAELEKSKIRTIFQPDFIKSLVGMDNNVKNNPENKTDGNKVLAPQEDLFRTILQRLPSVQLKETPKAKPGDQKSNASLKSNTEANKISSKDKIVKEWYEITNEVIAKMYLNVYQEKRKLRGFHSSFQKFDAGKDTELNSTKEAATDHKSLLYSEIQNAFQRSSDRLENKKSLALPDDPLYQVIRESLFKQSERKTANELNEQKLEDYNKAQNFVDDPLEIEEEQLKKMEASLRIVMSESFEQYQKKKALEDHELKEKVLNLADSHLNNELKNDDQIYERLIPTGENDTKELFDTNISYNRESRDQGLFSLESEGRHSRARKLIENDLKIGFSKSRDLYTSLQYSLAKSLKRYEEEMALEQDLAADDQSLGMSNELFFEYLKKMVDQELTSDGNIGEQLIFNSEKLKESEDHLNLDSLNGGNFKSNDQPSFSPKSNIFENERNLNENIEQKLMDDNLQNEFLKSDYMYSALQDVLTKASERNENEMVSRNSEQNEHPNLNADQSKISNDFSSKSSIKKTDEYANLNVLNNHDLKSNDQELLNSKYKVLEKEETANALKLTENDLETELSKSNEMYSVLQFSLAKSHERQRIIEVNLDPNSTALNLNDDQSMELNGKSPPKTSEEIAKEEKRNDEKIYEQLISSGGRIKNTKESVNLSVLNNKDFKSKNQKSFYPNDGVLENGPTVNENVAKELTADDLETELLKSNEMYSALQGSLAKSSERKNVSSLEDLKSNYWVSFYPKNNVLENNTKSNYWESFYPGYDVLENEPTVIENIENNAIENDLDTELSKSSEMYSALQSSLAKSSERMEKEIISKNLTVESINPNLATLSLSDDRSLEFSNKISPGTSKKIVDKELARDEKIYQRLILAGEKSRNSEQNVDSNSATSSNLKNVESAEFESSRSNESSKEMGDHVIKNKASFFDAADKMISTFSKSERKKTKPSRNVPIYLNLNNVSEKEMNSYVESTAEENFKKLDEPYTSLSKTLEADHDLNMTLDVVESNSHESNLDDETEEKEFSTEFETEEIFASFECPLEKDIPKTDLLSEIPRADQVDFMKLSWDLPREKIDKILSNFSTDPLKSEAGTENQSNIFQVPLQSVNNEVLKENNNSILFSNGNKINPDFNSSKLFSESGTEEKSDSRIEAHFEDNVKFSANNEINLLKDLDEPLSDKEGGKIEPEENLVMECYETSNSQVSEIFNAMFLPRVAIGNILEFSESDSAYNSVKNEMESPDSKIKGRDSNLSVEFQSAFSYSRKFMELYPWWKYPDFTKNRKDRNYPHLCNNNHNVSSDFETELAGMDNEIITEEFYPPENYNLQVDRNSSHLNISKKSLEKSNIEFQFPDFTEFYSPEHDSSNQLNKLADYKLNGENFFSNEKKIKYNPRDFLDSMEASNLDDEELKYAEHGTGRPSYKVSTRAKKRSLRTKKRL